MAAALFVIALLRGREDATIDLPSDAAQHAIKAGAYSRPLGAAVSVQPAQDDGAYLARLIDTFTSVTPENAMKWAVVEPSRGHYKWAQADSIVSVAQRLGKRVRGHPLLWDQQLPSWVMSDHDVEGAIREHVRTLAERYRGRVAQWDVVNEPLEDDGSLTRSVFERALGERFIDLAFRVAREADPKAQLFLNELSAERGPKLHALVALAKRLKARGVPIDGIGLQNHTNTTNPPTQRDLAAAIDDFAQLGLKVEITEMDVVVPPGGSLARQADAFGAAARACAAAAACTGLTVWGVDDKWSWLGAAKRPLLIDASGRAKPALATVRSVLNDGH